MAANPQEKKGTAAFFDIDGTLAKTTIVHYYVYFRRRRMPRLAGAIWQRLYMLRCVYYLILDKIDRVILNRVFYRDYKGLSSSDIRSLAVECHKDVIVPRMFTEIREAIASHKRDGRMVAFVTGSIDFIIAPLAEELGADVVIAPSLAEKDGKFTGTLEGPPLVDEEKAKRIRALAEERNIDLSQSFAYGDSISDRHMLEAVGRPQAVSPDKALAKLAKEKGWPIHQWSQKPASAGAKS